VDFALKVANQMAKSNSQSLSNEDVLTNNVVGEIYASFPSDEPQLFDTGF
jgi:hypothetical protein